MGQIDFIRLNTVQQIFKKKKYFFVVLFTYDGKLKKKNELMKLEFRWMLDE